VSGEALDDPGIPLDDETRERLLRYVQLLIRENRRCNLIGTSDVRELWSLHVADSLTLLPCVERFRPRRLLDLGSGGGLPGIPLACACPQMHVTLLDATRRKTDALRRIVAELQLPNVPVIWGRAETLAHNAAHREVYDVVVARAVAPVAALCEYASGFVRPGGQAWFMKSLHQVQAEVTAAAPAAQACELALCEQRRTRLPDPHGERVIVIYIKRSPLRSDLPRPPGRARKRPLGSQPPRRSSGQEGSHA